ncbi:MAG: hypothetical protein M5U23_00315 [Acidimicrobiia bacterium]|nr:hypothetical protein [Acidimicrobiia bacterium]
MSRNRRVLLSLFVVGSLVIAACDGSSSDTATDTTVAETETTVVTSDTTTSTTEATTSTTEAAAETTTTTEAVVILDGCDWDVERMPSGDTDGLPTSEGDDLATVLIGSWQFTHLGDGTSYTETSKDLRYVFTEDTIFYCQDVPGITDKAENSAPLVLEGTLIALAEPAKGFNVVAWNDDVMVWHNLLLDDYFILKRR